MAAERRSDVEIFQDCLSIMRLYHFLCVINYIIFIIFPPEMRIRLLLYHLYIFFSLLILNINCSVYLRRMLLMLFSCWSFPSLFRSYHLLSTFFFFTSASLFNKFEENAKEKNKKKWKLLKSRSEKLN